jgi:hypothetical protein
MDQYGYDSFAGPSLNLRPDELDRLDASQIEPEVPSIRFDAEHYRNLEASINGTINALVKGGRFDGRQGYQYDGQQNNNYAQYETQELASPKFTSRPAQAFTPPSSQPYNSERAFEKPFANTNQQSLIDRMKEERDRALQEMQRLCDQRVESVQRGEGERFKKLEEEYRKHLDSVKQDLDTMLRQHEQVTKVKNEVQKGLEVELNATKRELRKERGSRETDKEKYHRTIRELKDKIRDLERELAEIKRYGRSRTAVSFAKDVNSPGFSSDYERRLGEMQRENDAKISGLVRHFEKEKTSALEILKTKIRAEVSLLIPRIKEQCARVYSEKLVNIKESLAARFREQYEGQLRRVRDEHGMERRLWQRQLREQVEQERAEIAQKLRAKYELRILDVKNECERRILQRLREGRRDSDYSDSDLSFV